MEPSDFKSNSLNYDVLELLAEGDAGDVFECRNTQTRQTMAVKLPNEINDCVNEFTVLEELMHQNFDRYNIVKFYGCLDLPSGKAPVFERLDMDLQEYITINNNNKPMRLGDIRVIIKQAATALDMLRSIGACVCMGFSLVLLFPPTF